MSGFSDWFQKESGYTLHRIRFRQLRKECCGKQPVLTDKAVIEYLPGEGEKQFWVYRCENCGAHFIPVGERWHQLENLLKYRVVKRDADSGS